MTKPTDWAFRVVCEKCKIFSADCLSDSEFWSRYPCPKCGGKQETVKSRGRRVRILPFVLWQPWTWFATQWVVEIDRQ